MKNVWSFRRGFKLFSSPRTKTGTLDRNTHAQEEGTPVPAQFSLIWVPGALTFRMISNMRHSVLCNMSKTRVSASSRVQKPSYRLKHEAVGFVLFGTLDEAWSPRFLHVFRNDTIRNNAVTCFLWYCIVSMSCVTNMKHLIKMQVFDHDLR